MEYIKKCLDNLSELAPEPVKLPVVFSESPCPGIKAVVFDIYGTLLVSNSGDIFSEKISPAEILKVFSECGIKTISDDTVMLAELILSEYKLTIEKKQEKEIENGIDFPEIDINEIWKEVLRRLMKLGSIRKGNSFDYAKFSFLFELVTNPVYPMPGMKNILMELKKRNKYLGIISNAQFYTPIIMNYFLSGKVSDDEYINMFDPELIRYSYKLKRAKPDIAMFEQTRENLARFGIMPHETLYIGNDMLKDVYPASKTGFRTVLFAGDRRSLKLRNEKPEISGLKPDFTIDNLEAVLRIAV